jgi:hypothetical protein
VLFELLASVFAGSVQADTFSRMTYDGRKDELVITMRYRGTNPDHTFSLQWGQCKDTAGSQPHQIVADVLDSQGQDAERADFTKTTRFALTDLRCRPATLLLRTAPGFNYILLIPAPVAR